MQTVSAAFLGWTGSPAGNRYDWRHCRDCKGSVDVNSLDAEAHGDQAEREHLNQPQLHHSSPADEPAGTTHLKGRVSHLTGRIDQLGFFCILRCAVV